jgi:hypothetical protein
MSINAIGLVSTVIFGTWTATNFVTKLNGNIAPYRLRKALPSITSKVSDAYNTFPQEFSKKEVLDIIDSAKEILILNKKGYIHLVDDFMLGLKNLYVCCPSIMDEDLNSINSPSNQACEVAKVALKETEAYIESIIAAAEVSYTEILGPAVGTAISAMAYYKTYDSQEVKPAGAHDSQTKDASYDNHCEL